jgi:hypothetical protein
MGLSWRMDVSVGAAVQDQALAYSALLLLIDSRFICFLDQVAASPEAKRHQQRSSGTATRWSAGFQRHTMPPWVGRLSS